MRFIKIESREQLDSLKKGDLLLVKWQEKALKRFENITLNEIQDILHNEKILLDEKLNSYFNPDKYLRNESWAREVYLVTEGDNQTKDSLELLKWCLNSIRMQVQPADEHPDPSCIEYFWGKAFRIIEDLSQGRFPEDEEGEK